MVMRKTIEMVGIVIMLTCAAMAQATDTPAPTPTGTPTPATSINVAFWQQACPTPPCTSDNLIPNLGPQFSRGGGYETGFVQMDSGTGTVDLVCTVAHGFKEIALATLTGADCDTTPANCLKDFQTVCDEIKFRVTSCDACKASAVLRRFPN